jgi:hypothetical protein
MLDPTRISAGRKQHFGQYYFYHGGNERVLRAERSIVGGRERVY